ncbi:MAG: hypothetical protein FWF51_13160 [Chitinivibrionia bacterium]|nr:hypothetical protein [Chitinivibrionia bacterium]
MKQKVLIIIILIFSLAFSQNENKKKEKVKFGGKAEIGIDYRMVGGLGGNVINDLRRNQIGIVEAELKILPADSVELEFDLEFDHRFTDLNLKKLFARYNFDNSNARLGFMKKMFSLEEMKKEELFIKESMINDILEDYFLLGHDFTAQYRYNFPSCTLIGGFAVDGSNRKFVNLTLLTQQIRGIKFAAAGMYERYWKKDGSKKTDNAFFGNLGMEFDGKITDFELEGFWGENPEKYGYNESEGTSFIGLRFQESFPIEVKWKHLNKIVPLYEASYFNESFAVKTAYWQARPGINFCFDPKDRLQWRTNFDIILTANNQTSNCPQIVSERVLTELFVTW